MTHRGDRTLQAAGLARVEGEGAMYVRADAGQVAEVRLDIYEPSGFFEAFGGRAKPGLASRSGSLCRERW